MSHELKSQDSGKRHPQREENQLSWGMLAKSSMPTIDPRDMPLEEGSAEFRALVSDLKEDLSLILGEYVHKFEFSEIRGKLRIKCELRPEVAGEAVPDVERLVRRITEPMPVEFQVLNPQADPGAHTKVCIPDWRAREHKGGGPHISALEEDIRQTLPVGIHPITIVPFTLSLYEGGMKGVHIVARVPQDKDLEAESWRKDFEKEHGVRVHLRKEWVRAGLERSLSRIAGEEDGLLTDEHVPAIAAQLRRWFGKEPPTPLPERPDFESLRNARDLRNLAFVTIDQEGTQNPEDALYAERRSDGGIDLYAAIVDITWAVEPHTAEAEHFASRAISLYCGNDSYPLMGKEFAYNQGSFLQDQDRLAWVFRMEISPDGALGEVDVSRALIRNKAALTPEAASENLTNEALPVAELVDASRLLRSSSLKQGSFVRGEGGQRTTDIVSDCMMTLYGQVGQILATSGKGGLFTTYQVPSDAQLNLLMARMESCGVAVSKDDFCTGESFSKLWDRLADSEDVPESLLSETLDRFFPRSLIGSVPDSHRGLGIDGGYARIKADGYVGLVNQWALAAVLADSNPPFSQDELERIARQQNRKKSSIDSMRVQVRVMNMLCRNLNRVGETLSASLSPESDSTATLISVRDSQFSKGAELANATLVPEGEFDVTLCGFNVHTGRFVFEPVTSCELKGQR